MFLMLSGIPGSGKSTLAKYLTDCVPNGVSIITISSDNIREEINGDAGIQDNAMLVWTEFYYRAHTAKTDFVILDATFLTRKDRKRAMKHLTSRPVYSFAIIPDLELALKRNSARKRVVPDSIIESMCTRYTLPSTSEGFKEVFYINAGDLTLHANYTTKI